MTERGLPIVDGAPACPFVAFDDDRDERAAGPDHRHRCYAETPPAPRALAHQEAYCLASAFPVCPTFQDWARREAARARGDAGRPGMTDAAAAAAGTQRNPPRNWAAPPPWLSGERPPEGSLWAEEDEAGYGDPRRRDALPEVPRQGRGLSGSYADRVAADSDVDPGMPGGLPDHEDLIEPPNDDLEDSQAYAAPPPTPPQRPRGQFTVRNEAPAPAHRARGGEEEPGDAGGGTSPRARRRERELPAPEWERSRPLEAYPALRSRRLSELSVPPVLVAIVALALSAAVLFALPGLLGFGSGGPGGSPSPTTPIRTATPSINPTPVPQATPTIYVVQAGDTLSRIAGRYGITLADLIAANAETLPDPDKLQIGDQLIIPVPLATEIPAASEIPAAT